MTRILASYDDLDEEGKRMVWIMRHYEQGSPEYNDAFNELYRLYYPLVFSVAGKEIEDYQLAEDTVHEAFIRFMKTGLKQFRGDSPLSSYLCAITKNTARNIRKKRDATLPEIDFTELNYLVSAQPSPAIMADENTLIDVFHAAIENLPPKQNWYMSRVLDGYKYTEIAEMTDRTEGTVKTNIFEAKKNLRNNPELVAAYA
ncbi:MAG: sigma-70 family RNA polymerase sigma factor [Nanoarchaeota archaeon]